MNQQQESTSLQYRINRLTLAVAIVLFCNLAFIVGISWMFISESRVEAYMIHSPVITATKHLPEGHILVPSDIAYITPELEDDYPKNVLRYDGISVRLLPGRELITPLRMGEPITTTHLDGYPHHRWPGEWTPESIQQN